MPRLALQAALGVGIGGALADVSSFVRSTDGLRRSWGRDDAYFGVNPGSFEFVLDNSDGRFTPDNPSSVLATKLAEGARACVSVGGRLTAGTVRTVEPVFPGGDAAWAAVRVKCDDVLGLASRTTLLPTADALNAAAGTFGVWKFDEDKGETRGFDSGPSSLAPFAADQFFPATVTFGGASLPWSTDTQLVGGTATGTSFNTFTWISNVADFGHDANSGGFFSFWYTPISNVEDGTTHFQMQLALNNGQVIEVHKGFGLGGVSGKHFGVRFSGEVSATSALLEDGVPVFVSVGVDVSGADLRARLYVNGVLVGSRLQVAASTTSAGLSAQWVKLTLASSLSASSYLVSRFSHTRSLPREDYLLTADSEAEVIAAVAVATPGLTVATLPAGLSGVPVALPDFGGQSSLDVLNEVQNTEQGHLYATTSGTLLAPVEELAVRERARPRTVKCSFDVVNELSGAPGFVRDITNLVSSVRVRGASSEVTVSDAALVARAGNASDSVDVLFTGREDMRAFGQDRLIRGSNTAMRIASVVVDLMTTPTDRSADVLGLVPGDRVQFTNLPSAALGFTTWDGWFLGAVETHTLEVHEFELFFEPVLADVALYDDDRYDDGDVVTLGRQVRTNLVTNPSFEVDTAGWGSTGSTRARSTTYAHSGVASMVLTASGGLVIDANITAKIAVAPGATYTWSVYALDVDTAASFRCSVQWFTALSGGSFVSASHGTFTPVSSAGWVRLSFVGAAPSTAQAAYVYVQSQAAVPAGASVAFDAASFELAHVLGGYFDGSTVDTASVAYDWTGTAHASTSTERDAAISATATTVEFASTGALLTTTDVPFTIQVGSEQMTVTAVTGTTSPQTATVVRGVNGTTATTHAEGAAVAVVPTAIYGF